MLKKILKFIGGGILFILLLIACAGAWYLISKDDYDAEAFPKIAAILPIIPSNDPVALDGLMSPIGLGTSTPEKRAKIYKWFAKLGAYKSHGDPMLARMNATTDGTSLTYKIQAQYENGPAEVTLVFCKCSNGLQLNALNVNSNVLLE